MRKHLTTTVFLNIKRYISQPRYIYVRRLGAVHLSMQKLLLTKQDIFLLRHKILPPLRIIIIKSLMSLCRFRVHDSGFGSMVKRNMICLWRCPLLTYLTRYFLMFMARAIKMISWDFSFQTSKWLPEKRIQEKSFWKKVHFRPLAF